MSCCQFTRDGNTLSGKIITGLGTSRHHYRTVVVAKARPRRHQLITICQVCVRMERQRRDLVGTLEGRLIQRLDVAQYVLDGQAFGGSWMSYETVFGHSSVL